LPLNPDQWLYFFCLAVAVPLYLVAANLLRARTGRAIVAIRDHPLAAAAMGIDTAFYKTATFGVSALYTGVAGSLAAILTQFVSPDSFPIFLSLSFLVGIIVGGISSISGAVFGAVFIEFVPNLSDSISQAAPLAVYGVALIALMYLMPDGVAGRLRALRLRRKATREPA
jgi:branched-chain amino acid transport system permease protein